MKIELKHIKIREIIEDYKNDDTENALFKAIEYIISIDLAKEIAMLEKSKRKRN